MYIQHAFADNLLLLALFFIVVCFALCMSAITVHILTKFINRKQHRCTWYENTIKQTIDEIKIHPKGALK